MPIFEFVCTECGRPFEELVRSTGVIEAVICPLCGSSDVKKQISTFAARIAGGDFKNNFASSPAASCSTGNT